MSAAAPPCTGAATRLNVPTLNAIQPPLPDSKPGSGSSWADGVTALLFAESGPVPDAFTAATVKVYVVPFVNVVIVMGELDPLATIPPG